MTQTQYPSAAGAVYPDELSVQTPTTMRQLAEFPSYDEAQALVDRLSDSGFDVKQLRIVGTGLHSVEQVLGRMTKGRAALAGAASGAWFGLLIGLLFGLFAVGAAWLTVILGSLVIGAFWGAVFGFIAQWATRGRRDFSSVKGLEADRYSVQVDASHYAEALQLSAHRPA
jgi:hypothetical protein